MDPTYAVKTVVGLQLVLPVEQFYAYAVRRVDERDAGRWIKVGRTTGERPSLSPVVGLKLHTEPVEA